MYSKHFGLNEIPFSIAPDPRYLYMSERHREALAHLVYGIRSEGGFVLLTGEAGTGKTTVCRCLLEQQLENTDIAFILNPKVSVEELLAAICDELRISYPEGTTSIKVFIDRINSYLLEAHSRGRKTVLIIEEAQNLSVEVLEQIRLLTNLETNQRKLIQIMMIGQPELREMLSKPELRQLSQRITARYHLSPLSGDEVAAYVKHRLAIAGARSALFPESVMNMIFKTSGGIPRLINILCDRALLGAYVEGKEQVDKKILTRAAREISGETNKNVHKKKTALVTVAGVLVFCIIVFAAYSFLRARAVIINVEHNVKVEDPVKEDSIAEAVSEEPRLSSLQWPGGRPASLSQEMAYQELFRLWGMNYDVLHGVPPCRQAAKNGMRCLNKRGSLSSIRGLDSPAVLRLMDNTGQEFYALLARLDDSTATFIVAGETKRVALMDLAEKWFGDFTILWKIPPSYQNEIKPGDRGAVVSWLSHQMRRVSGRHDEKGNKELFDEELVNEVKQFQLAQGIVPDGIVGPQTLIRINRAVGEPGPGL